MFEKNLKGSWSRSNNDIARDRFISLLKFALTLPSVTILTRFTKSDMSFASSSQQQLRKPMFGQIFPPIRSYRVHNLFSCSTIVAWQFYKYVSKPQQRQLNFSYNESAKKFGRIKKRKFFEDFTITDLTSCCC